MKNGRFTHLLENLVINWLQELSTNAVGGRFNQSWNAVDRILREAVARGLRSRATPNLTDLSVDEVSRKKNHIFDNEATAGPEPGFSIGAIS
jgi:hypothetical protein